MDISKYKHSIKEVVKFHEIDMLGVCNNAVYFNYFEDARIKYLQDIKKKYQLTKIMEGDSFFIMAHNYCDYILSAQLDDELDILTKVKSVKNSSFEFEHIVKNKKTEEIIAKGGGVLVHINVKTKKSMLLPDEFYRAIQDYEKGVEINRNS